MADPHFAVDFCSAAGFNAAVVNTAFPRTLRALVDAGLSCWTFMTPDKLDGGLGDDRLPDEWELALTKMSDMARDVGARGPWFNGEKGFGGSTHAERGRIVDRFLDLRAKNQDVCFVTFDGLRRFVAGLAPFLIEAGVAVSPELYNYQKGASFQLVDSVYAAWRAMGWQDVRGTVGSIGSDPRKAAAYYDALRIGGIVWPDATPRGAELDAIKRWAKRIQ